MHPHPADEVPDPPDFRDVEPAFTTWPARQEIVRVYDTSWALNSFNPGVRTEPRGRFHFFEDAGKRRIAALYGAQGEDAAIAETVFHDVPVGLGSGFVPASRLTPLAIGRLRPRRDLVLVELLGYGLRRLGLRATNLTDTDAALYPRTVPWAAALHAAFPHIDGLIWMSRQFNAEQALVLFGDRVGETDLEPLTPIRPLLSGPGRAIVERAANRAGIVIG